MAELTREVVEELYESFAAGQTPGQAFRDLFEKSDGRDAAATAVPYIPCGEDAGGGVVCEDNYGHRGHHWSPVAATAWNETGMWTTESQGF